MQALRCPVCDRGFMRRKHKQCPRCATWLVKIGEYFTRAEGERAFLWLPDSKIWSEIPPSAR